jgi:hypothetical protein
VRLLDAKHLRSDALVVLAASMVGSGEFEYKLHELKVDGRGCSLLRSYTVQGAPDDVAVHEGKLTVLPPVDGNKPVTAFVHWPDSSTGSAPNTNLFFVLSCFVFPTNTADGHDVCQ